MKEIKFEGSEWTSANNRKGEGFVEEKLDRIFAFPEWFSSYPLAVVHRVYKQSSDHYLLRLEDKPTSRHFPKRFYFDRR